MTTWDDIKIPTEKRFKTQEPYVRLYANSNKATHVYFNNSFIKSIAENYIIYGYSKSNNAIVLFFVDEAKHPGSVKLFKRTSGCSSSIQSFLNLFGLEKNAVVGKYKPTLEVVSDEKLAWVIYLNAKIAEKINLKIMKEEILTCQT